jgi:hypothetical protein
MNTEKSEPGTVLFKIFSIQRVANETI